MGKEGKELEDGGVEMGNKLHKEFTDPIYCRIGDRSVDKIIPIHSRDSIETMDFDVQDYKKKSLWNKQKKKLNFLSNLIIKDKNTDKLTNSHSYSFEKNQ